MGGTAAPGAAVLAGIAEKRHHSRGAFQPPSVNWSRRLRPLMGPPASRSLTQAQRPPSVATAHDGLDFFHTHAPAKDAMGHDAGGLLHGTTHTGSSCGCRPRQSEHMRAHLWTVMMRVRPAPAPTAKVVMGGRVSRG